MPATVDYAAAASVTDAAAASVSAVAAETAAGDGPSADDAATAEAAAAAAAAASVSAQQPPCTPTARPSISGPCHKKRAEQERVCVTAVATPLSAHAGTGGMRTPHLQEHEGSNDGAPAIAADRSGTSGSGAERLDQAIASLEVRQRSAEHEAAAAL